MLQPNQVQEPFQRVLDFIGSVAQETGMTSGLQTNSLFPAGFFTFTQEPAEAIFVGYANKKTTGVT